MLLCSHLVDDPINFFLECLLYQQDRTSLFKCFNNIVSISIEYIIIECNEICLKKIEYTQMYFIVQISAYISLTIL